MTRFARHERAQHADWGCEKRAEKERRIQTSQRAWLSPSFLVSFNCNEKQHRKELYSWVWRKGTEKSRYKLYGKVTELVTEINAEIICTGIHIETGTEYTPEQLHELAERYAGLVGIDSRQFKHGRGHHKSIQQRHYEKLVIYAKKLSEYVEKLRICGTERNS